jgi:hypothetical protein
MVVWGGYDGVAVTSSPLLADNGGPTLTHALAFGGSVTGFTPIPVIRENTTTGQRLRGNPGDAGWDCEALGLTVVPGQRVATGARGTAD